MKTIGYRYVIQYFHNSTNIKAEQESIPGQSSLSCVKSRKDSYVWRKKSVVPSIQCTSLHSTMIKIDELMLELFSRADYSSNLAFFKVLLFSKFKK